MKRRLVSFMLVIVMLVTMLPVTAFAAGSALPAESNGVITLTEDVTLPETELTESVTLDLNGFTITGSANRLLRVNNTGSEVITVTIKNGTIKNPVSGGRCVETRSGNVILNLTDVKLETTGGNYDQTLTVGGNGDNITVNIVNSEITASTHYAITTFNPVKMKIEDSSISGYAALYMKGVNGSLGSAGSVVNVINSTLTGFNKYNGDGNNFGAVVLEDSNITINLLEGSSVVADGNGDAMQNAILNQNNSTGNVSVSVDKTSTMVAKKEGSELVLDANSNASTTVDVAEGNPFMTVDPNTGKVAANPINYVSIGDSMANGYGFKGYNQTSDDLGVYNFMTGAGMYGEDAYPLQFEEYLTEQGYAVNHTKLAPSALLAEDLLYLLDGREEFDDGWRGFRDYVGDTYKDQDAQLKDHFQTAITDADVITMGIGNAAFGAFMLDRVTSALGVFGAHLDEDEQLSLEDAIGVLKLDAEQHALIMQIQNTVMTELVKNVPAELVEQYNLQQVADIVVYTAASYIINYKLLVEKILEMNPDVEIVLVGLLNTTYGMNVTDENGNVLLPFGDVMDNLFGMLNAYMAGLPTVLQEMGVAPEAKIYYAEQPAPKFICQEFENLLENNWEAQDSRLDGATIRDRNIDAFNDSLGYMIGMAVTGAPLAEINLADVEAYEALEWEELALAAGSNWNPWMAFAFSNHVSVDWMDPSTYSAATDKILSVAIYLAIEEAVARNTSTMDIPLEGLMKIAGDLSSVFTELGPRPEDSPESIRTWLFDGLNGPVTGPMCKIYGLFKVGNGMSVHPTPAGHDEIAQSVIAAYDVKHTAKDETVKNVQYALDALYGFLEEYGPQAADQAYKLWVDMGYQELVDGYIAELTTAIDARYTHYTEVVLPALNDTVDALNAQKDELTAELATLKDQLAAKKAELEKVLAEQEIPEITPPEFNIETELGNNEQTQVPENDCAGAGNVADELAAAVADLEHAIAVVEALIADVTADIEDMVALATEIAEGVATLEKTLADVAAAAQDLKDAVDAVVTVLTDDSAKGISKTFMKAFNTAREAALIAADALELIVKTVNDDFAAVEGAIDALKDCAKALADKFDADKEAILMQIAKDIPTEALMIVGGSVMLIQQTLEENKAEIMAGLDAAKNEALTKLNIEKDKVLADLAIEKAKLEAEYGPKIDEAKLKLDAKRVEINNEIQTRLDNLNTDAQIKIDALKTDAQLKIDALNAELQGYMNELNGLAADASAEVRAAVQAQIDRVNADIAAVNADLACAIDHVNAELKAAHDAMVAEVNRIYNNAITELQTIYDNLVKAYDDAVKNLQDAADEAIKNLQDAYNEAVKDLTDAADKAIQDLIDAANKELDKLGELGDTLSGIIDGILQAIQGDIAGAQQAISGILNGVQDSVADLGNALVDLGIDTVNALVDEVTNVINDMLYQATHADLELSNVSSYIALGDGTAVSAGYAEKLAAQLEEEYGVTNFKNYAATSNTVGAEVAAVATREGIADADLITIGFGNVTLLDNAIANAMSDSPVAYDWAELVGEDLVPYIEDALAEAYAEVAAAGMDEEMTAMVNAIVEGFAYGAVEYAIELPALIAAIREVNADAVIVVVGQYNPMDDVVLDLGGDTLDLSEYIDYFVDAVAVHGIGYSVISGDAIFVEAPDVDTDNTDMNWSILDLGKLAYNHFDSLNPSESGDVYIANQILGALNITHVVDTTLLGDVTLDGKVNAEDVTALMAHLVGTQPLTDARALLNGDVDANNKLSANDVTVLLGYLVGTVPALPAL